MGISLSNPAQRTDHTSLTRRKLQAIRTTTRPNLETSQERHDKRNTGASGVWWSDSQVPISIPSKSDSNPVLMWKEYSQRSAESRRFPPTGNVDRVGFM